MSEPAPPGADPLLSYAANIVSAYVSNNTIAAAELPALLQTVYATLGQLAANDSAGPHGVNRHPAVSIKKSITPDFLICLEDGKKFKSLKRHLRAAYGLTPEDYRARWNLSPDYPMVAPNYARTRSSLAVKMGLGQKPGGNNMQRKHKRS
jgi:predicted transcriptional regulator